MTESIFSAQVNRLVNNGSRRATGPGRMYGLETSPEVLLNLIIVIVIVLLLSQEGLRVGMAL
jgi:hypothetical protein